MMRQIPTWKQRDFSSVRSRFQFSLRACPDRRRLSLDQRDSCNHHHYYHDKEYASHPDRSWKLCKTTIFARNGDHSASNMFYSPTVLRIILGFSLENVENIEVRRTPT